MKKFKEYIREMKYGPNDRESSNIEDERDSITNYLANLDKPAPPSAMDWARHLHKKFNPSTVKPPNSVDPKQANKEISDTFQKSITPSPHNRFEYVKKDAFNR